MRAAASGKRRIGLGLQRILLVIAVALGCLALRGIRTSSATGGASGLPPTKAIAQLRSPDRRKCWQAVTAIMQIDPETAQRDLKNLIGKLKGGDGYERYWAAVALERMGSAAKSAVPALIAATRDAEPAVRVHAAVALKRVDAAADPVVSAIATLLDESAWAGSRNTTGGRDPNGVEQAAAEWLTRAADKQQLVRLLIQAVGDPLSRDSLVTPLLGELGAANLLGEQQADAITALISNIRNSRSGRSLPAAWKALGRIGLPAVGPLIDSFSKEADKTRRSYLSGALTSIGKPALPQLIEALKSPNPTVRASAAETLRSMKDGLDAAAPALIQALADPDVEVRRAAAFAIWVSDIPAKAVVPRLIQSLKDPDFDVVHSAMYALEYRGRAAADAAPALVAILRGPKSFWRARAAQTLGLIGDDPKLVVPALMSGLDDADSDVRLSCLDALQFVDPLPATIEPALQKALTEKQPPMRYTAAILLLRLAPQNPQAQQALRESLIAGQLGNGLSHDPGQPQPPMPAGWVDVLLPMLDNPFEPYWERVVSMLGALGPTAAPAASKLVAIMREYQGQRPANAASECLAKLGPNAVPAVEPLVASDDAVTRVTGAWLLWKLGQREKGMRLLLAELNHPRKHIRESAAARLSGIITEQPTETPAIVAVLNKATDARARAAAASALMFADTLADRPAIQALIAALAEPAPEVRAAAANTLAWLCDSPPPCAWPLQQDRFTQFAEFVRYREAHVRPWPDMPQAVQALTRLLLDDDATVRTAAVGALGKAGREAVCALPLLAMLESDEAIQFELQMALQRIEPWSLGLGKPEPDRGFRRRR